jgi:tetratricopeptide (TPR) repeat protein
MALDKRQTSVVTKVIIVILAIMLVIGIGLPFLGSIGSDAGQTSTQEGTLDTIAARYQPNITGLQGALASAPTSGTILLQLAYTHYDYASDVQQASSQDQTLVGMDVPLWVAASDYYRRAYEAGQDAPEVTTELAVTYHYSNRTPEAIARIEQTLEEYPDFPTAWFNAGIFYQAVGAVDDAIASFERYLELDPQGTAGNPDYVRDQLAQLQSAVGESPVQPGADATPVDPEALDSDVTPVDPSAETTE